MTDEREWAGLGRRGPSRTLYRGGLASPVLNFIRTF
jgi:hypothetical protein